MRRQASKHNLMLTFADTKGAFLADVDVKIADAKGEPVLQTKCDGPLMLVDFEHPGTYSVQAEAGGYAQRHTVSVSPEQRVAAVELAWPTRIARMHEASETATGASGTEGRSGAGEGGKR